jgi:hypothetical protein
MQSFITKGAIVLICLISYQLHRWLQRRAERSYYAIPVRGRRGKGRQLIRACEHQYVAETRLLRATCAMRTMFGGAL